MMIKAFSVLEIILPTAQIAIRWHTQIKIIWGEFICETTNYKGTGRVGKTTRTRV